MAYLLWQMPPWLFWSTLAAVALWGYGLGTLAGWCWHGLEDRRLN